MSRSLNRHLKKKGEKNPVSLHSQSKLKQPGFCLKFKLWDKILILYFDPKDIFMALVCGLKSNEVGLQLHYSKPRSMYEVARVDLCDGDYKSFCFSMFSFESFPVSLWILMCNTCTELCLCSLSCHVATEEKSVLRLGSITTVHPWSE